MAKRKLTADEKAKVHDWALERERQKHPGANITITVKDEIDENGNVEYGAVIIRESVVPRSEVPF